MLPPSSSFPDAKLAPAMPSPEMWTNKVRAQLTTSIHSSQRSFRNISQRSKSRFLKEPKVCPEISRNTEALPTMFAQQVDETSISTTLLSKPFARDERERGGEGKREGGKRGAVSSHPYSIPISRCLSRRKKMKLPFSQCNLVVGRKISSCTRIGSNLLISVFLGQRASLTKWPS